MIYLVDTTTIDAADTDRFLSAFEDVFLPSASRRGMELVACWHTPADLGEDVTVTAIFRLRDWSHWNDLRRALVLDPATGRWVRELESMRKGATRRFYHPAPFSPLR